jgi:hypothetical protein
MNREIVENIVSIIHYHFVFVQSKILNQSIVLKIYIYGYFHGNSTTRTKVFSDFDKIFSAYKAFNYKHFDKKNFFKNFFFHRVRLKILLGQNTKNDTLINSFFKFSLRKQGQKLNLRPYSDSS